MEMFLKLYKTKSSQDILCLQEHEAVPQRNIRSLAHGFIIVLICLAVASQAWAQNPPYPPSPIISDIIWDFSSHDQRAPGSDNWPVTWADDGHQYTSWGDGGGFGGTNSDGRVSLGFARVEGPATAYAGFNVWGGKNSEAPATFGGKSYGILAIGNDLYTWRCGDGSGNTAFRFQRLYKSIDGGRSWTAANWEFAGNVNFYCPTFLQFGRGYSGARDGWVYMYAAQNNSDTWDIQIPGKIMLMRAPKTELMNRSTYEFFTGLDANGQPQWSSSLADRKPVFEDPNGVHLVSVSYNAGLRRYLLTTPHTEKNAGNIGIFDASEPWGPWTTVLYENGWGAGYIETNTFFWNFSNKWLSADGMDFVLVFTGKNSNDSWNIIRGTFVLSTPPDTVPPSPPVVVEVQ
jgi:hypothetical protein